LSGGGQATFLVQDVVLALVSRQCPQPRPGRQRPGFPALGRERLNWTYGYREPLPAVSDGIAVCMANTELDTARVWSMTFAGTGLEK
jgi:hypothetical protein